MLTYFFVFFKTLSFKKFVNGALLRLSYLLSMYFNTYVHWGNPESLSIEPTNLCNLKCPECPSGNNSLTRSRLFINEADYKSIIEQSYKTLTHLQLFFQGEPFLHPKLSALISHATEKKVFTSTSTNGQFLTTANCIKIVNSGLHHLIVSIDGTTQDIYELYRVGGSLATVIEGIKNLNATKKALKRINPIIELQFVVLGTNEHQIPEIKALSKTLKVNRLQLKTAQIENFKTGNPLIPDNKKYSRYVKNNLGIYELNRKRTFYCSRIWFGSVISVDKQLLPCCFDKNAEFAYDTNTKNLNESWKSVAAQNFRKQVWKNPGELIICQNCSEGLK